MNGRHLRSSAWPCFKRWRQQSSVRDGAFKASAAVLPIGGGAVLFFSDNFRPTCAKHASETAARIKRCLFEGASRGKAVLAARPGPESKRASSKPATRHEKMPITASLKSSPAIPCQGIRMSISERHDHNRDVCGGSPRTLRAADAPEFDKQARHQVLAGTPVHWITIPATRANLKAVRC